ncbi:MAG: type II/IV secretion system protein [Candidatus Yonathbacteria bacterium]|nr:type II/IV secretion system protein [Candidatus Yonathbacteria bacterium]NTW47655.1 type II/IV secretion system protein [Candidatus Yonathbacteria bacterium]
MTTFQDPKQDERFRELQKKEQEDLVVMLAERHGFPHTRLSTATINTDALRLIPEAEARKANVAPFALIGKRVKVGATSPTSPETLAIVDDLSRRGYEPEVVMISQTSIEHAWVLYPEISKAEETEAGVFDVSGRELVSLAQDIKGLSGITDAVTAITDTSSSRNKISRVLEALLGGAVAVGASDIHFEPEASGARVRMRIDGVLIDVSRLNGDMYRFLLSRIKLLSGLKLNITENSQDGRFSIRLPENAIEIRTSVIPEEHGESVVMRLLNPESLTIPFEELGIDPYLFAILKKEINRPDGLVLTTGPTGSGKTTTLYSFLKYIHTPEVKIITIENPIEYHLDGITQTQTNTKEGYTFVQGLKTALRQDPDIIMVGEIRDSDTAQTALNAAFTGHLVFSTLHTNNAAGVIPRLVNLGVNPKLITSGLNVSLAQRLTRRLCPTCKRPHVFDAEEQNIVERAIDRYNKKRGTDKSFAQGTFFDANTDTENTCPVCGGLGYKGRIGVYEGILTDEHIEAVILSDNLTEREIKKAAEAQNIPSMAEDGIAGKMYAGLTSFHELRRVVDVDET